MKIFNSKNVSMKVIAGAFLALTGCCESASCSQQEAWRNAALVFNEKDMWNAMYTSKSELVKELDQLRIKQAYARHRSRLRSELEEEIEQHKKQALYLIDSLGGEENTINAKDEYGNTPLMYALYCRSFEVAKKLIDKGASLSTTNNDGVNAIMLAAMNSTEEEHLTLFINATKDNETGRYTFSSAKQGVDVKQTDNYGQTVLFYVFAGRDRRNITASGETYGAWLAKLFIELGVDVNKQRTNNDKATILTVLAERSGSCLGEDIYSPYVDILVKAGAEVFHTRRGRKNAIQLCLEPNFGGNSLGSLAALLQKFTVEELTADYDYVPTLEERYVHKLFYNKPLGFTTKKSLIQIACSLHCSEAVDFFWYLGLGSEADYDCCLRVLETCNRHTSRRFHSLKNSPSDTKKKILISDKNAHTNLKNGTYNLYELYNMLPKNEGPFAPKDEEPSAQPNL